VYHFTCSCGIVGLGVRLGYACPELEQIPTLFKIVAVCDPLKERRDWLSQGWCRAYRRYQDNAGRP